MKPLPATMMAVGLVSFLGCQLCKLTRDPDCDWTRPNNDCTYICAEPKTDDSAAPVDERVGAEYLDGGLDGSH